MFSINTVKKESKGDGRPAGLQQETAQEQGPGGMGTDGDGGRGAHRGGPWFCPGARLPGSPEEQGQEGMKCRQQDSLLIFLPLASWQPCSDWGEGVCGWKATGRK